MTSKEMVGILEQNRVEKLQQVIRACFDSVNDGGHPCGECTICLAYIPYDVRYVTWELHRIGTSRNLEHICMECDWLLRNYISSGKISPSTHGYRNCETCGNWATKRVTLNLHHYPLRLCLSCYESKTYPTNGAGQG